VSSDVLDGEWKGDEAQQLFERRRRNGRRLMTIAHHEESGYRVWARGFGRHIVANDGLSISCAIPRIAPWQWQRLLFGQVLPLAGALRGLELFHASAVAIEGNAVGFVAASGTGKTTLAAHLVARGAQFMTDDVLSLEPSGKGILAHPGPNLASVDPEELRSMNEAGRERLGKKLGRDGKVQVAPGVVGRPLPLAAVYFLDRSSNAPGSQISIRENSVDPRLLLTSSFINYVGRPEHLLKHLDTCARLEASVPLFDVVIPRQFLAVDVATAVQKHLREVL
jgi:hypothetical protein